MELVSPGFEPAHRVHLGCLPVEFGEGPFLAPIEIGGEETELIEDITDRVGLCLGPVGEGRLGSDEGIDLFEFDDVGPVGDDPGATCVLDAGRVEEPRQKVCRVDVGVGDPFDKVALIGRCGGGQLLEFGPSFDQLASGANCERFDGCFVSVGEPAAVLEDP